MRKALAAWVLRVSGRIAWKIYHAPCECCPNDPNDLVPATQVVCWYCFFEH